MTISSDNLESRFRTRSSDLKSFYHLTENLEESDEHLKPIKSLLQSDQDRYLDLEPFARGGMKQIFSALDSVTNRPVAIANLRYDRITNAKDQAEEQFLREARITAALQHPNIMPVYDMGVYDDGSPFFVMKLIYEDNLAVIIRELLKQNPYYIENYPLPTLLDIFVKVCDAVSYAHSKNILHLDLKPGNIQVGDYGDVLLCDWGLAKIVDDPDQLDSFTSPYIDSVILNQITLSGTIKGTPGYMAPEQIDKSFGEKSVKTDIYALGAILYTILTLKAPIEGDSKDEFIANTINGKIKYPCERNSFRTIPEGVAAVAMKALSPQQIDRYHTVRELLSEIQSFIGGFATEAEGATFFRNLLLLFKRHRNLSISLLCSFLMIITMVSFFIVRLEGERSMALQAQDESRIAQQKTEEEFNKRKTLGLDFAFNVYCQAMQLYRERKYEKVIEKLNLTLHLNPRLKEAQRLKGYLTIGRHNLKDGESLIMLINDSRDTGLLELLAPLSINKTENKLPVDTLLKFCKALIGLGRKDICEHLVYETGNKGYSVDQRFELVKELMKYIYRKDSSFVFNMEKSDKGYKLSLAGSKMLNDITLLKNLPIVSLDLENTRVADLSPLDGVKLQQLILKSTPVVDISVVKKMPLKYLDLTNTFVQDLSSLTSSPIMELYLSNIAPINVESLSSCSQLQRIFIPQSIYEPEIFEEMFSGIDIYFTPNDNQLQLKLYENK